MLKALAVAGLLILACLLWRSFCRAMDEAEREYTERFLDE